MYWIIAAVVVVLTIALPKFRRIGIVVGSMLLILLGWAILRSNPWVRTPEASKQLEASRRIPTRSIEAPPLNTIKAEDLKLTGGGAPWNLTGRLTNTSARYRITAVALKIERRDCFANAPDPSGCVLIWQGTDTVITSIPPNEWREFADALWLHESLPRIRGEVRDAIEVTGVEGAAVSE